MSKNIAKYIGTMIGPEGHLHRLLSEKESRLTALVFDKLAADKLYIIPSVRTTKKSSHSASKCALFCFGCIDVSKPFSTDLAHIRPEHNWSGPQRRPTGARAYCENTPKCRCPVNCTYTNATGSRPPEHETCARDAVAACIRRPR